MELKTVVDSKRSKAKAEAAARKPYSIHIGAAFVLLVCYAFAVPLIGMALSIKPCEVGDASCAVERDAAIQSISVHYHVHFVLMFTFAFLLQMIVLIEFTSRGFLDK